MIGLHVSSILVKRGISTRIFDLGEQVARVQSFLPPAIETYCGSVLEEVAIERAAEGCDTVIHLAGMLGVKRTEANRTKCLETNIFGTKRVLDAAVKNGAQRIVFASSSEVYGEPFENPVTEDTTTQGKTVYAVSKMAGEELCKAYGQRYGLKYVILRYFNCYGPYQVAQFAIPRFIHSAMRGKPPTVFGDGHQKRCYTFVEDTAEATVSSALSLDAEGCVLNVGSGNSPISLLDLANLVIQISGKNLKPEMVEEFRHTDRTREREVFERYCTAQKAKKRLNWEARVSLAEGIRCVFEKGILFERWPDSNDIQA